MLIVRRCFLRQNRGLLDCNSFRRQISSQKSTSTGTDSAGIPLRPTWSVNELLSSYPTPTISSTTLNHLHELSALIPPTEGTQEHDDLKLEMEELVKLVEAVKLVNTEGVEVVGWSEKRDLKQATSTDIADSSEPEVSGRELMKHAARTAGGFYVVDADKPR